MKLGESMAACRAHPLDTVSTEFSVLESSLFGYISLRISWMAGILVASPTSSTKSIFLSLRPDFSRDSETHFLNLSKNGAINSSSSVLLKCLWKSSSSMRESQLISASLLDVSNFLIFSIESSILKRHLAFGLGSQPYFLLNSPPKRSNSR